MLSAKYREIATIYAQHKSANQPGEIELEAKFLYFDPKSKRADKLESNIPYVHFERLLQILRSQVPQEIIEESHVAQQDNIRRVTTIFQGNNPEQVTWEQKNTIRHFELPEYDIRVSINNETPLNDIPPNFKPTMIRDRTRHKFIMSGGKIHVDMTEVIMRTDMAARPRYEVEVEFKGTSDELAIFDSHVSLIFKWLRGTNIVFTNTSKRSLITDINLVLGSPSTVNIDKSSLVLARNIKKRDIVYGGIVGNPQTAFEVTPKTDGVRKMLLIHTTGIWLVYPPFEYNLVVDANVMPSLAKLLSGFSKTILDGEFLVTANISHRYIAIDCIAFRGHLVTNNVKSARDKIVDALSNAVRTPILTIDTKKKTIINTPDEFFSIVAEFLDEADKLDYPTDGLIFTPVNVPYNPGTDKYPLRERSLTRYPDVVKWKPGRDMTIDFSIKVVPGGLLELYSFDRETEKLVKFEGDNINKLTPDMIDHTAELTLNKPTNLVVEYEWDGHKLRPRKIRYDKSGPNSLEIAKDDWEDIMNPITEEDLKGLTFKFTYAYHNRIKRSLYRMIPKGSHILDIGSGRGADVYSWKLIGGSVVAVEPNSSNREVLVSRVMEGEMNDRVRVVPTGGEDNISITRAVREFIPGGKVDVVTLMLSMSFFWASDRHLDALVQTIITNLKRGGMIIFLTINGDAVEQLFEPALSDLRFTDKHILSAHLHLYQKPSTFYGRPLDITLPNTIVGEQREYLVYIQDFVLRLRNYGLQLGELHRADNERLLSNENKVFSSLYSYGYLIDEHKIMPTDNVVGNIILPEIPQAINLPLNEIPPLVMSPSPIVPNLNMLSPPIHGIAPNEIIPNGIAEDGVATEEVIQAGVPDNLITNEIAASRLPAPPTLIIPTNIPTFIIPPAPSVKLNKYQIEERQLPGLDVSYTGRGGRIQNGPAKNDDNYAPVTCTWYDNIVRIATIGDGSCFISN